MDPIIGGALIGGGASLIGGFLNRDSYNEAAWQNRRMQEDFARNGLRWRIEDAKAAGISPLAALGFNGPTPTAQMVGDTSLGNALGDMGQNIGRAISQTKTEPERKLADLQVKGYELDLQNKEIENQIKMYQLGQLKATGPSMPGGSSFAFPGLPGQGDATKAAVKVEPAKITASAPGRAAETAGLLPGVSYYSSDHGINEVIPQDLSEPMEDDPIGKMIWRLNNTIRPFWDDSGKPAKGLPKGYKSWQRGFDFQWHPSKEEKPLNPYRRVEEALNILGNDYGLLDMYYTGKHLKRWKERRR